MFGTAGHSVVYQGMASPGLSDASTGKHLFVSFLLFAGPTWAVAARAPPLPFGLGIKVSWHFECLVSLRSPQDCGGTTHISNSCIYLLSYMCRI